MDVYRRKVSGEEARHGHLLVERRRVRFFPPPGEEFDLEGLPTRVESYACSCRGPEKPHEHWYVRVPGLRPGEEVEVEDLGGGRYALRRPHGEPVDELP